MKHRFKDMPMQRKLVQMTMSICLAVLMVAAVALFLFQVFYFRSLFERNTETIASIVANNSTAALAFEDRAAATEILASLKAKPSVLCACLVRKDGEVMAHYGLKDEESGFSEFPPPGRGKFSGRLLFYSQPVQLDNKTLGTLYLRLDYHKDFFNVLAFYGLVMLAVFGGSTLLAVVLSGRFQRHITDPLLSLAQTATTIGKKNDYSVRSEISNQRDEIGALATAFNGMLERIEQQDAALTLSQQKLEGIVNSLDGVVWEWDPTRSVFTFVSRQTEQLLGYPADRWIGNPAFWESLLHPEDRPATVQAYLDLLRRRKPYVFEYRVVAADGRVLWIRESGVIVVENDKPVTLRGIFQDVTREKKAAADLEALNRKLLEISRQAGMAEVATGVLHNVGNVLNSANVSATVLRDRLRRSERGTLRRVADLLQQQNGNLATFLTEDPKGKLVPRIISGLADELAREQQSFGEELDLLVRNIDHIKEIVAMQQSYARVSGLEELLSLPDLVEDALRINNTSLKQAGITVIRRFDPVPQVLADNHKVLQILVNLIRNAKFAMEECPKRELTVSITAHDGERIRVLVGDTGVGISADHLTRIFSYGFTTRKDGHGFGLHIGALDAKQMGGSLTAASHGPNCGSTFTLELPLRPVPAQQP